MQSGKRLTSKDYFAKHSRTHKNHENRSVKIEKSRRVVELVRCVLIGNFQCSCEQAFQPGSLPYLVVAAER